MTRSPPSLNCSRESGKYQHASAQGIFFTCSTLNVLQARQL